MASGAKSPRIVSFVGTGANLDIDTVGFEPKMVRVLSTYDGSELSWMEGMGDGDGILVAGSNGNRSVLTTTGITPRSGGFRIGADGAVNVSGKTCFAACWE